jgi:restriction endonuclease S subunit
MSDWDSARVCDVCEQVPVGTKYSKELVQDHGNTKVIDQSQADIFGWHNNSADIYASPESPVFTFANHTCSMRWMDEPFSVIQNVFPMRGIPGKTDTRFLYYASGASVVQDGYKGHFPQFRESIIQIPPLPEQKKIAEILSGIDKLIASAEQQEAKNRNLALSIAENILTSNHEHRRLGDVTTLITKGTTPTSLGMSFSEQGINFIKVESIISDGVIDPVKFSFIGTDVHGALKRSQIKSKDILFTIAGATVGKLALIDEHLLPANTNQALAIIRVKSEMLRPRFAYHWLKGGVVKNIVAQLQTVGAQPNVSLSQISDFPMPIMPLDLQDYICHKLDSIDRVIDSIHKKIFTMQYLRQSLASDLLSGRKRVSI